MQAGMELPADIIVNILSRLPVKPLGRFKSVSKQWLTIIDDPHFSKAHLTQSNVQNTQNQLLLNIESSTNFYSLNPQTQVCVDLQNPWNRPLRTLGSCNGIILLGNTFFIPFALWNPLTGKHKSISTPTDICARTKVVGLGYNSVTNDFKVVRVVKTDNGPSYAYVFSSRSSCWRIINQAFSYSTNLSYGGIFHYIGWCVLGTVHDGAPHWILKRNTDEDSYKDVIVYFDPHSEKFREFPLPDFKFVCPQIDLTFLRNSLCVFEYREIGGGELAVWAKKGPLSSSSWSELFVVRWPFHYNHFKALCFIGEGKDGYGVVAVQFNWDLVLFDLDKKETTSIEVFLKQSTPLPLDAVSYRESLFSP